MVYFMEYYVDGGCRRNGRPDAIGAAAAVKKNRWGKTKCWVIYMPDNVYGRPTNQKAEIMAIILALELALQSYEELSGCPHLELQIFSDSKYAVNCMDPWKFRWKQNGWINSSGNPVANQELIKEACDLEDRLMDFGNVTYTWLSRDENEEADWHCNRAMDKVESEGIW